MARGRYNSSKNSSRVWQVFDHAMDGNRRWDPAQSGVPTTRGGAGLFGEVACERHRRFKEDCIESWLRKVDKWNAVALVNSLPRTAFHDTDCDAKRDVDLRMEIPR